MRLFAPDLSRHFVIGFVLGAALVVGANVEGWAGELSSPAHAATMSDLVEPSAEFVIPAAELR